MATYRWHESSFITEVAQHRGYRLEGGAGSGWRLHGTTPGPPSGVRWTTTLTPASGETGPQIVWRTTDLRAGDDARRQLVVGRSSGTGTSFGDIEGGAVGVAITAAALALGNLWGRRREQVAAPTPPVDSVLGPGWSVIDPCGVVDAGIAPWFTAWPAAWWGPDDERPASIDRLWLNQNGLDVAASGWWCSAPALDQLVQLGGAVAGRLLQAFQLPR